MLNRHRSRKMGSRVIFFSVVFLFLLSFIRLNGVDEAKKGKFVEIDYYRGQLLADYLPFNEKFLIKGSPALPFGEKADVVVLTVKDKDGRLLKSRDKKEVVIPPWIRHADGDNEFKFIVGPMLELKKTYKFCFEFFQRPEPDSIIVRKIVEGGIKTLSSSKELKRSDYRYSKAKELLQEVIKKAFEEMKAADKKNFRFLVYTDSGVKIEPSNTPKVEITEETISNFLLPVQLGQTIEDDLGNLETNFNAFYDFVNEPDGRLENLLKKIVELEKAEKNDKLKKMLGVLKKDVTSAAENVEGFLEELFDRAPKDLSILNIYKKQNAWLKDKFGAAVNKTFVDVVSKVKILVNKSKDITKNEKRYLEEIGTQYDGRLPKSFENDLRRSLEDYLVRHSAVSAHNLVWPTEAKLKKLRLGTIFGYAMVALPGKEFKNIGFDGVAYVGVKYYLGPVDISGPDPYLNKGTSRLALTFGTVLNSELHYEGQKQDNFAGVKPMFGLSYDFRRALGINAGLILFRQPSPNALAVDRKEIRLGLYAGITFDANLFNKLKELFKL